jgi:hypothetical protein
MSLKALHLVFVTASVALTGWLAVWFFQAWSESQDRTDLVMGIGSAVCAVTLVVYGRLVFKKLKNLSYL